MLPSFTDPSVAEHSDVARQPGAALERLAVAIVAAAALALAAGMFAAYYAAPDALWSGIYYDRNTHYSFGQDLAIAIRTFDPGWFFTELEKARVWPPVHGLVLSVVLALGGIDHRLGIVPSLAGWVMTLVFTWLCARRMFAERTSGMLAAAVAVTLTAASPAFRLLASDVMLEGLGAGLSALALWSYLRLRERPLDTGRARLLALTLTLLFFHKGNYWGLVVASLAAAFVSENPRHGWALLREFGARVSWKALLARALRDPLLILFAVAAALAACLYAWAPPDMELLGKRMRLYPPENVVTVAYALLFVRLALLWRAYRVHIDDALGAAGRAILYWHVAPVAISFLLPHRLSAFLWFVGPANTGINVGIHPIEGAQYYLGEWIVSFHAAPWIAYLAGVLILIAILGYRRFPPPMRAVFFFAALSFLAVAVHPQHQGRFITTWAFAVWIIAGVGAGLALDIALPRAARTARALIAAVIVAALVAANAVQPVSAAAYRTAFRDVGKPSDLDLVRPYLDRLDGLQRVGYATTFGSSKLFDWAFREHCRCHLVVDDSWLYNLPTREAVRDAAAAWVARTDAELLVIVDAPSARYEYDVLGWTYARMSGVIDAMNSQNRFVRAGDYPVPSHGANVSLWRRR